MAELLAQKTVQRGAADPDAFHDLGLGDSGVEGLARHARYLLHRLGLFAAHRFDLEAQDIESAAGADVRGVGHAGSVNRLQSSVKPVTLALSSKRPRATAIAGGMATGGWS